ncbi:FAD-dependent monooxygenase [Saccharopolyspora sp. HNM0983]|uniref:FAD-dependent monooxygenase n=1 Tax=Saccharopolyspora montiporae TaxID=2781240 RepID=A0A929B8Q1_9PSEU|nr:FAD-dependent monooxygenase [Saccharopolyspora sp. HNM0983]MBE9373618.1 FAD-dependent monooxygenase [Saccharopolyspora sp. HNM0983]
MSNYHLPRKYPAAQVVSMTAQDEPLPVVVAGAGPVGMAVALGLARRGIPVTVLEAADQVSFGSRAICLSRHSMEIAERLGLAERLEQVALPWVGGRSFYRDRPVLRFEMPHSPDAVRAPMVNLSQSELEQVMVDALQEHPLVTLHWRTEVSGCAQTSEDVRLDVDTAEGIRHLRARWVVAADGGRSQLRALSGLRMSGTSYQGSYVIADIHWPSGLPTERMVWFDAPSNPGSTIIMHRQPGDIWRIDYQLDAADDPAVETTEERIRARITRHLAWLDDDTPWTLEWHGFYRAHALALDEFVHQRTVFAGDAAHLVPIFGVRGLNSGLEDAETLTWQLAAVLAGNASTELLGAYSQERRAAWQHNVDNAAKSTLIMSPGGHGYRTTRDAVLALAGEDAEFSALVDPRQSSATHAHGSPLTWPAVPTAGDGQPGAPLQDRRIRVRTSSGEVERSLGTARGSGWSLLAFGLDDAAAHALAAERERLAEVLAPDEVRALAVGGRVPPGAVPVVDDGALAAALHARPGEVLVIRPDGLLLARLPGPRRLREVAEHLPVGTAPAGPRAESGTVEETALERTWLTLSRALDGAAESDREGLLTRLALLLGRAAGPEEFQRACTTAEAATPEPAAPAPAAPVS